MTEKELKKLIDEGRQLLAGSSKGPWAARGVSLSAPGSSGSHVGLARFSESENKDVTGAARIPGEFNAALAAYARNALETLLDELEGALKDQLP